MKNAFGVLGAAALMLAAANVHAQVMGDGIEPLSPVEVMQEVYPVGFPPATYSSRAVGVVYNNGGQAGTNTNGTTLGVTSWGDEMDFSVGPWAGSPTRLATNLVLWIQSSGTPCVGTSAYDILVDFWADADHDYNVDPMITGGATPLASLRVAIAAATCGVQSGWNINLTGLPGGGVSIPTDKVYIQYRLVETGTTTLRPVGAAQSNFPVFGIGTTLVGQSTPSYCRDVSLDQVHNGGTPVIVGAATTGHEHRRTSTTLNTNQRCQLSGDIPPPPEPTNEDLGTLTDAGLTITRPITAGETKWYKFTITNNAADNFLTFLDIDNEGSAASNTSIGLYNAGAGLVAFDHDDGSATTPQLTFGVGRRAAPGDGRQYDGRDAELTPGTYLLAVSSGNASFGDAYSVTSNGTDAGDVTIRFATNVNGTPPAPAVVPAGPNVVAMGQILSPGLPGPVQTVGRLDTVWYSLTMCAPVDGANYLDIDLQGTTTSTDTEIFLFNSSGNLVAQNDDDGGGALSILSFGNAGPRAPQDGTSLPFTGQNGTLPIGDYYLGVGLFNTTELNTSATDGRFHIRSASGSSLPVTLNFYTNIEACGNPCPGNACGDQDFNGDGDFGTDQDIEAFFACLGGTCCPTCFCQGSDFNGDGDFGTDQDIEAFFRVLAGGNC